MTDGENGRKYAKYADIEAVLSNAQGVAMTDKKKHAGRTLSAAWEAMMQAHDHTTAAVKVREAGLEREFYLIALAASPPSRTQPSPRFEESPPTSSTSATSRARPWRNRPRSHTPQCKGGQPQTGASSSNDGGQAYELGPLSHAHVWAASGHHFKLLGTREAASASSLVSLPALPLRDGYGRRREPPSASIAVGHSTQPRDRRKTTTIRGPSCAETVQTR